eukprot:5278769-Amphidinium_carterae.1
MVEAQVGQVYQYSRGCNNTEGKNNRIRSCARDLKKLAQLKATVTMFAKRCCQSQGTLSPDEAGSLRTKMDSKSLQHAAPRMELQKHDAATVPDAQ